MIVLYIILGIIGFVLILALFVSKRMDYEKSISIDAKIEDVWRNTNTLTAMDKWSPWNAKDPNMQKILSGTDGQPGAKQSWISDVKNVGEGSQTIISVNEPNEMGTRLDFIKPFKSTADAYVRLTIKGERTTATWGFKSSMPYPMNLMKLFMNFEKEMNKEFGEGLDNLKGLSEAKS